MEILDHGNLTTLNNFEKDSLNTLSVKPVWGQSAFLNRQFHPVAMCWGEDFAHTGNRGQ